MPRPVTSAWIVFILISNITLLGHLHYYQTPAGTLAGLPEVWVTLFLLLGITFVVNSVFAWLYLGKPDLRQVFALGRPSEEP